MSAAYTNGLYFEIRVKPSESIFRVISYRSLTNDVVRRLDEYVRITIIIIIIIIMKRRETFVLDGANGSHRQAASSRSPFVRRSANVFNWKLFTARSPLET